MNTKNIRLEDIDSSIKYNVKRVIPIKKVQSNTGNGITKQKKTTPLKNPLRSSRHVNNLYDFVHTQMGHESNQSDDSSNSRFTF